MKSMNKNNSNKREVKLGKKSDIGYRYSVKINFKEDLATQISKVIKEKELNGTLKKKIRELNEVVEKFLEKEKNLQYYYEIGEHLLFLDRNPFKEVARGSILRRIFEEIPNMLPDIKDKDMAGRHLNFMYWIAHIGKEDLSRASWEQWFEITKFKEIYKNKKILQEILNECKKGITGHSSLNERIKRIIEK